MCRRPWKWHLLVIPHSRIFDVTSQLASAFDQGDPQAVALAQALAQSAAEGAEAGEAVAAAEEPAQPFVRSSQKVGRNDPCPCGSGKKYKNCHGRLS